MSDSCYQFSGKTQFYIFHIKLVKFPVYDPVSIYIFFPFLFEDLPGKTIMELSFSCLLAQKILPVHFFHCTAGSSVPPPLDQIY